MNKLTANFQVAFDGAGVPDEAQFHSWAEKAWLGEGPSELTLRIVDNDESRGLNHQYRCKDTPTNALSFPSEAPACIAMQLAGVLVTCAAVVEKEAQEQHKEPVAHWAHMVVHGMLHLQGYDHIADIEPEVMEALEVRLLSQLGFANPYEAEETEPDS